MKLHTLLILNLVLFCTVSAQEESLSENLSATAETVAKPTSEIKDYDRIGREKLPQTQTPAYTRPTAEKRFKRYVNNAVGPSALIGVTASAAISTATNRPEEWSKSTEGFGRRFASNLGKTAIRETAIYGLDEAFKLDSGFYRSAKRDTGSKIKNAFVSTFTARKTDGKRVVGVPRLVGTYAANIIAVKAWYPNRFDYREGLRGGTISLGINVGFNLLKEFVFKK